MIYALWLSVAFAATPSPEYAQAKQAYEAYPEDYAVATHMARVAESAEDPELALEAWDRAGALAGENAETALGRIGPLTALERYGHALRWAQRARRLAPGNWYADLAVGWAAQKAKLFPGFRNRTSSRAFRRADRLDDRWATPQCGQGWARLGRGDRPGARAAFREASEREYDVCSSEGRLASARRTEVEASLYPTALVFHGGDPAAGATLATQVGVTLPSQVRLDATVRGTWIQRRTDTDIPFDVRQQEGWLRASYDRGAYGVGGLFAVAGTQVTGEGSPQQHLGAQGYASFGLDVLVQGLWSNYAADHQWQLYGQLGVPLDLRVRPVLGVQWIRAVNPPENDNGNTQRRDFLTPVVGLELYTSPVTVSAGLRTGAEYRPVRYAAPFVWNTADAIAGSGWATATIHPWERLRLFAGWELLHLTTDITSTDPGDRSWEHAISAGATWIWRRDQPPGGRG